MITAGTKRISWKRRHPIVHKVVDYVYTVLVWSVIIFAFFSCAVMISWLMQEDIEAKNNYQEQTSEMVTK